MDKFSLITIENTISDTDANVSFAIICDNPNNVAPIKRIEVDLQSLQDVVQWSGVLAAITSPLLSTLDSQIDDATGLIRFTFSSNITFKNCNNRIEFCINNLLPREGLIFPESAEIRFRLRTITSVIGTYPDDYLFNTIYVASKKPIIKSCKINPSITREATDVTLTYQTINASTCEVKDQLGQTINIQTNINKDVPFSFSFKKHLGSAGTSPAPPFYLHAREGVNEAVENTVANVIVTQSPQWFVMDNFSRSVETLVDGNVVYVLEQFQILDLVLNEYDDMMWAIMQKRKEIPDEPDAPPCIWKSSDGISWLPHSIYLNENNVVIRSDLTIPPELVHCPCIHFGQDELYFIGGSKVDINVCKNTITVIDLKNGGIRTIEAPSEMTSRCMHACLVYPDVQGNDNIWVIGGADKNGNGLNDVWRYNGNSWIAVPTGNVGFPKRCRFAATVQTDINGNKSIWIGGGAARYNGSTLNDLWVNKGPGWIKVRNSDGSADLTYSEEWMAGVSICYLQTNKNSIKDTNTLSYRYIISSDISGTEKKLTCRWILPVDTGNNYYKWNVIEGILKPEFPSIFESLRSFSTTTIGFNGCIWTVILAYISKGNISISSLYYSCPVP
ncbi:kelch repeat-containing protein [Chitinophaga sp.]|uniref:kelch repeat-containing protein n=1 Tax=Chitinophaga sp. TaxID=1869181 RepID=UPI0031DEAD08